MSFRGLWLVKIKAHGLIALWMKGLRQETKRHAVTVWVYVEKVKVAEGKTSWLGEDIIAIEDL